MKFVRNNSQLSVALCNFRRESSLYGKPTFWENDPEPEQVVSRKLKLYIDLEEEDSTTPRPKGTESIPSSLWSKIRKQATTEGILDGSTEPEMETVSVFREPQHGQNSGPEKTIIYIPSSPPQTLASSQTRAPTIPAQTVRPSPKKAASKDEERNVLAPVRWGPSNGIFKGRIVSRRQSAELHGESAKVRCRSLRLNREQGFFEEMKGQRPASVPTRLSDMACIRKGGGKKSVFVPSSNKEN